MIITALLEPTSEHKASNTYGWACQAPILTLKERVDTRGSHGGVRLLTE